MYVCLKAYFFLSLSGFSTERKSNVLLRWVQSLVVCAVFADFTPEKNQKEDKCKGDSK